MTPPFPGQPVLVFTSCSFTNAAEHPFIQSLALQGYLLKLCRKPVWIPGWFRSRQLTAPTPRDQCQSAWCHWANWAAQLRICPCVSFVLCSSGVITCLMITIALAECLTRGHLQRIYGVHMFGFHLAAQIRGEGAEWRLILF